MGGERLVSAHGLDAGQQVHRVLGRGAIKRLDMATRAVQDIPFHVTGTRGSIAPTRFQVEVAPDQVESRMVRFATVSPDGRRVVYESFGRLWIRDVSGGNARQLTNDNSGAFELFLRGRATASRSCSCAGPMPASARFTSSALAAAGRAR